MYVGLESGTVILLLFVFLNWRIIALKYYVGFCHTSAWISHRYTHVPSLNLPPTAHHIPSLLLSEGPSLSSLNQTANSHWLPALHIVMCMFPLYSLHSSHPLCAPLTVSIGLFSMSASPLLPCRQRHQYHPSRFHIYVWIYDICFSLSDLLHSA